MRKRRDGDPFRTRADMLLEAALDDCDPDRLVPSGHDRAWVRKKHADIVREVVVGADVMSPAWAVELERRGLLADLTFVTLATADVETRRQALAILQIAESHAVRKAAIEELVRQVAGRVTGVVV